MVGIEKNIFGYLNFFDFQDSAIRGYTVITLAILGTRFNTACIKPSRKNENCWCQPLQVYVESHSSAIQGNPFVSH